MSKSILLDQRRSSIGSSPSFNEKSTDEDTTPISIKFGINSFDIWALGITISIGGQYFLWNFGLVTGVGTYGIAILLLVIGYIILICNTSEVTSGLPFTGGSYGLARCALGNYWGFLIGIFEIVEYVFYVAASMIALESMFELLLPNVQHYPPISYLIIHMVCVLIHTHGGRYFWMFNRFLAIVCILIVLLFVFGSLKYVDFNQYASWPTTGVKSSSNPWFVGGFKDFMKFYPLAAFMFLGPETLKETCNDLDFPKVQLPRGQISAIVTLVCTCILVFFVCVSLPPGIVDMSTNIVPFNAGFQLMFDLTDADTHQYATILSLPATFATTFGFIMMYGKIMAAMSKSKLLPAFLEHHSSKTGAPWVSLIIGSLLSYGVCVISYCFDGLRTQILSICILNAFCSYSLQCICYILLKTKYSNIECGFHSPFGMYGGIFSLFIWLLGIVAVVGFQGDQYALIAVCVMFIFFTVWYFAYARYHQSFSDEEKEIFLKMYIINHNHKKKNQSRKSSTLAGLSSKMMGRGVTRRPSVTNYPIQKREKKNSNKVYCDYNDDIESNDIKSSTQQTLRLEDSSIATSPVIDNYHSHEPQEFEIESTVAGYNGGCKVSNNWSKVRKKALNKAIKLLIDRPEEVADFYQEVDEIICKKEMHDIINSMKSYKSFKKLSRSNTSTNMNMHVAENIDIPHDVDKVPSNGTNPNMVNNHNNSTATEPFIESSKPKLNKLFLEVEEPINNDKNQLAKINASSNRDHVSLKESQRNEIITKNDDIESNFLTNNGGDTCHDHNGNIDYSSKSINDSQKDNVETFLSSSKNSSSLLSSKKNILPSLKSPAASLTTIKDNSIVDNESKNFYDATTIMDSSHPHPEENIEKSSLHFLPSNLRLSFTSSSKKNQNSSNSPQSSFSSKTSAFIMSNITKPMNSSLVPTVEENMGLLSVRQNHDDDHDNN